jgi:hypothetical protein
MMLSLLSLQEGTELMKSALNEAAAIPVSLQEAR